MTFLAEICRPTVDGLHVSKRWEYWRKRGRGGVRETQAYNQAFKDAVRLLETVKGDRPPFIGPVLLTVRGYWPMVRQGANHGGPSDNIAYYLPAIVDALRSAGVIMDVLQGCHQIATSHVSSETRIAVDVRQWEGT